MRRYIEKSIIDAAARRSSVVILRMDTPGGLDSSMRAIIKAILAAPLPVVAYVAPSGARAASAGTYILYACHIAAMAPATNLGAATPIPIGGEPGGNDAASQGKPQASQPEQPTASESASERKSINDAVAYIRGLAQMRGRNADWAESAVRSAASLSSQEALAQQGDRDHRHGRVGSPAAARRTAGTVIRWRGNIADARYDYRPSRARLA